MQRIIIIGAYSSIAEAAAREYARRGAALFLVGRNQRRLDTLAADLQVRGAAKTAVFSLDVNEIAKHSVMLDAAQAFLGGLDIVLISHGTLPSQTDCDASLDAALHEFTTNGTSTIALVHELALRLKNGSTLAVISSVAGDRGRASNYLYGAAKAAVSAYLSGLGQRLNPNGIHVLTIKPGFVDTPMTSAFKKGVLWAKPEQVARGIVRAVNRRKSVTYLPWFWWPIMTVIKHIPEFAFRRIKL
ncbi:SDR family oxidoreductase [Pseudoxanthomonas winnipegensis]|jgi:decaprenylphospho-beta-D-erythro-pentofuranosid-2-ulose 2-reductase|uniref:SDR family oxidoreductase n=1 Tax=Pseudoxanthomonas winnipegensis TaxID=2480810 RepID=A0ABY1WIP9_9GAMM|nr:SDR family oxidoreductase [Pseudoxanthomonas winnipegensis]TAA09999.1 SDR family oxidoreductase [Pseudoxanthomonas winnipegensis]TAA22622.1 SDR family oxidoreductase [Pseudoxanthomonas winnipegensis]TAH73034.1 SDR family oxidoreductase [Pseudoxanthomonas winnipegensis]